jgi:hypothetical protein
VRARDAAHARTAAADDCLAFTSPSLSLSANPVHSRSHVGGRLLRRVPILMVVVVVVVLWRGPDRSGVGGEVGFWGKGPDNSKLGLLRPATLVRVAEGNRMCVRACESEILFEGRCCAHGGEGVRAAFEAVPLLLLLYTFRCPDPTSSIPIE